MFTEDKKLRIKKRASDGSKLHSVLVSSLV